MQGTSAAVRTGVLAAPLVVACLAVGPSAPAASRPVGLDGQSTADFTPRRVSVCLRRAQSSQGIVLVGGNSYLRQRFRARAVLQFTLMYTDYGLPGVNIVFASRRSDIPRLRRAVFAYEREMGGLRAVRSVVFRRRANVLFYYDRSTLREIVRIANGCLGGPQ